MSLIWTEKNLICAGLNRLIDDWLTNAEFATQHPSDIEGDTEKALEACRNNIEDLIHLKIKVQLLPEKGSEDEPARRTEAKTD